jgi:hypothetical protein
MRALRKQLIISSLIAPRHLAAACWFSLGVSWDENSNIHQRLYIAKQAFAQPFFMEVFMIGVWCLWKEINDLNFNNKGPSLAAWKSSFKARSLQALDQNQKLSS